MYVSTATIICSCVYIVRTPPIWSRILSAPSLGQLYFGVNTVNSLYKKYNIARNERASLIIDPNIDDATYDLTLGDGRKLKIKVNKNPDGTKKIYMRLEKMNRTNVFYR